MGSLYGASSHSFVFLGFDDPYFVRPHIHLRHMRTLYKRMYMLILLYELVLNRFALLLMTRSRDETLDGVPNPKVEREMEHLRESFLKFTNGLWFSQVTSQIQGREIFELMRKHSVADNEYQFILGEIERTDQYYDNRQSRTVRKLDSFVRNIALPVGTFITLTTLKEDWVRKAFPYYENLGALINSIAERKPAVCISVEVKDAVGTYLLECPWEWYFWVNIGISILVWLSVAGDGARRTWLWTRWSARAALALTLMAVVVQTSGQA